ncbi:MAG: hypothetical protein ABFD64_04660 [Armatimonadota bacterium]
MQITESPKAESRNISPKKRIRKFPWPQFWIFLIAVVVLVRLVTSLKASGFLIACGLCGLAFAVKTALHMDPGLKSFPQKTRKAIIWLWLAITASLCISFIFSGVSCASAGQMGARLAGVEAKRTVLAAVLFIFWLVGVSPVRRGGIVHILLWTIAVLEAARLLAFGLHPSVLSYIIWGAALVSVILRNRHFEPRKRGMDKDAEGGNL